MAPSPFRIIPMLQQNALQPTRKKRGEEKLTRLWNQKKKKKKKLRGRRDIGFGMRRPPSSGDCEIDSCCDP